MITVKYEGFSGETLDFSVITDENGQMISLLNPNDPVRMNWIRPGEHWGTVTGVPFLNGLEVTEKREMRGSVLTETFSFFNSTESPLHIGRKDLSIAFPLPDYYKQADECLPFCCHTHLWCAKSSSWILALRMNGKGPHLGIILREGSLSGYGVTRPEKDGVCISNDRGLFLLHPEETVLPSGGTFKLSFELAWFESRERFSKYIEGDAALTVIHAERFVLFPGENLSFDLARHGKDEPEVFLEGRTIPFTCEGERYVVRFIPDRQGEFCFRIKTKHGETWARFIVLPAFDKLLSARCHFIAEHQQCVDPENFLYGAYLIYDNETGQPFYSHVNDFNGGRERIGMGCLLSLYLQRHKDVVVRKSLDLYVDYVLGNLYDETTGEVFNDAPRNNDYVRLYNYPWMCIFFMEQWNLRKDPVWLDRYMTCVRYYYSHGGEHSYVIGMPMERSLQVFKAAGRIQDVEELYTLYRRHVDCITANGTSFPKHEVDYEQSIVAPAAMYTAEFARITGKEKYREAAKQQLALLSLFQAQQPDYHLFNTAIRHWDGYWFGKRKVAADTFPHYWSCLSGLAYRNTTGIVDDDHYEKLAEATLRSPLTMIHADGTASCAFIYPEDVNGQTGMFADPYANDQDWGLYFYAKTHE